MTGADRRVLPLDQAELSLEIGDVAESLVDAGESKRRHLIKRAKPLEDRNADPLRAHFGANEPGLVLDSIGDALEHLLVETSTLGRRPNSPNDVGTIERRLEPGSFHDRECSTFDPLERGEPMTAFRTGATAPNRTAVLGSA